MNKFMEKAINEARIAQNEGEVPVGAAVFKGNELIATAHNLTEKTGDVTAHAEFLAMKKASKILNSKYLTDCSLYVTLEPCAMCAGAAHLYKIDKIYFGAYDYKNGSFGGKVDLIRDGVFDFRPEVYGGIDEPLCESLLKDFFEDLRKGKNNEK